MMRVALANGSKWKALLVSTGVAVLLLSISSLLDASSDIRRASAVDEQLHQAAADAAGTPVLDSRMMKRQIELRELANNRKGVSSGVRRTSIVHDQQQQQPSGVSDVLLEKQMKLRDLANRKAVRSSSSSEYQMPQKDHMITTNYPYHSMFSAPDSDWVRKEGEEVAPTSHLLRVFVYDNLPSKFTTDVTSCILKKAGVVVDSRNTEAVVPTFSSLSTKMADVAILKLFETYPGRVYDPNDADIFVVPYPHAAHCYCAEDANGWKQLCNQVKKPEIHELLSNLKYYNAKTANRHLFVLSANQYFIKHKLMKMPLKLLGGNLTPTQVVNQDRGTIVIPYLNDKEIFQQVFTNNDEWWIRPRKFAFSFVFGGANPRNFGIDPRKIRKQFKDDWLSQKRTELGGLPVFVKSFDTASRPKETIWSAFDHYQDSIFCPILAGDSPQQSRFFDVMVAGCIPVVLEFDTSDVADLTSWYQKDGESTAAVYPFDKALVDFGVDYNMCVLKVPAKNNGDVNKLVPVMEDLLLHHPEQIRKLQRNLKECATRTTFGMGQNAHRYNDAFAQIVRMIRYHLDGLDDNNRVQVNQ